MDGLCGEFYLTVDVEPVVVCWTLSASAVLHCGTRLTLSPALRCSLHHHQEACLQGNLIANCLEQLSDPHPLLRQWVAICLGRIWQNFEPARWCGVRDSAHEKLYTLLSDPIPEVRGQRSQLKKKKLYNNNYINKKRNKYFEYLLWLSSWLC